MSRAFRFAVPSMLMAAMSCSHGAAAPTPAPKPVAPAPVVVVAPPPAVAGAGGAGGGAGAAGGGGGAAPGQRGGGRGPQLTLEQRATRRDSIAALRTATVQEVMAQIAGHETEPAGKVFKNVQMLKDMPAGDFVKGMDTNLGRGLGMNCVSCHVTTDWSDDSKQGKKTARAMLGIVAAINTEQMPKLGRPRTPQVSCVTCHRGNGAVNNAIIP